MTRVIQSLSSPSLVFLAALGLRLLFVFLFEVYRVPIGGEVAMVGCSIVTGEGFSSPFRWLTGPTAFVAPAYPYLVAAVFRGYGVYTAQSTLVLLGIGSFFSALTCLPLLRVGKGLFNPTVGLLATWGWALSPYAIWWSKVVQETCLSALLLSLALLYTLDLQNTARPRFWAGFGALWAVIALTNPALLSVLPFFVGWAWYRLHQQKQNGGRAVVVFGLTLMLSVSPWLLRNYLTFGKLSLRSALGIQFYEANFEGATGMRQVSRHPLFNRNETKQYMQMAEFAYMDQKAKEAMLFIRNHPAAYARLVVIRFVYYWFGSDRLVVIPEVPAGFEIASFTLFPLMAALGFLGLALMLVARRPEVFPIAACLAVFPVIYYLTHPQPRYRHPIEPVLILLGSYFISRLLSKPSKGSPCPSVSSSQT